MTVRPVQGCTLPFFFVPDPTSTINKKFDYYPTLWLTLSKSTLAGHHSVAVFCWTWDIGALRLSRKPALWWYFHRADWNFVKSVLFTARSQKLTVKQPNHYINPLHAELNLICHLLALLSIHHIFHVSGFRVNNNSMKQSPYWEANTSSTRQEIPATLSNPTLYYRICKNPPPVPQISRLSIYCSFTNKCTFY